MLGGRGGSAVCGCANYTKADRRVMAYYSYLVDEVFGPAFIKVCAYFPYPIKICVLTELRGESSQFRGQVPVCVGTVPARDRIGRAATGSCCVGDGAGRGAEATGELFEPYRLLDASGNAASRRGRPVRAPRAYDKHSHSTGASDPPAPSAWKQPLCGPAMGHRVELRPFRPERGGSSSSRWFDDHVVVATRRFFTRALVHGLCPVGGPRGRPQRGREIT